jgi:tRNA threonylcarbamoyladenosine biosynthesis protein TsaB
MAKDTIILSADTSSPKFSIALSRGAGLIAQSVSSAPDRQSSDMLLEIDRLLSRHSYGIEDIDLFSVGLGPGSFTGLRIGVTTMRAMAFALKKPIIGIPSIDALAHAVTGDRAPDICVIIDAKQGKIYGRFYKQGRGAVKPVSRILLVPIDKLLAGIKAPMLFSGDAIALYRGVISKARIRGVSFALEKIRYPEAAIIGNLSFSKWKKRYRDNIFTLSPLYIYPKECSINRRRKKL